MKTITKFIADSIWNRFGRKERMRWVPFFLFCFCPEKDVKEERSMRTMLLMGWHKNCSICKTR